MQYPSFYDDVEPILLYDPLSDFLGACEKGVVEINYLDCVKLAGHSCPTVAGAYLMTAIGLKELYGSEPPQRGFIHIDIKENKTEGVAGVIGNVVSYIVGASGKEGFKGIQGQFSRNNLISYGEVMTGDITLTRNDTNKSVSLSYDPSSISGDERIKLLMGKTLKSVASDQERELFKKLWQERVKKILLHENIQDKIVTIY